LVIFTTERSDCVLFGKQTLKELEK
jgi:hypothetical protein